LLFLVENKSLAQTVLDLCPGQDKNFSTALLTSLVLYTENFKKNVTPEIFELSASLMKFGADLQEITNNIFK